MRSKYMKSESSWVLVEKGRIALNQAMSLCCSEASTGTSCLAVLLANACPTGLTIACPTDKCC